MLEKLTDIHGILWEVFEDLQDACDFDDINGWGSLVINRRKPHTTRLFKQFDELRVCLHRFEACTDEEAFAHPHPWPGAFLLLDGSYIQTIGYSFSTIAEPDFLFKEKVVPGSCYEIINPLTWHKIQPTQTTHTIMINGPPFEQQHSEVKTTAGKDLDTLSKQETLFLLQSFNILLHHYHNGDI